MRTRITSSIDPISLETISVQTLSQHSRRFRCLLGFKSLPDLPVNQAGQVHDRILIKVIRTYGPSRPSRIKIVDFRPEWVITLYSNLAHRLRMPWTIQRKKSMGHNRIVGTLAPMVTIRASRSLSTTNQSRTLHTMRRTIQKVIRTTQMPLFTSTSTISNDYSCCRCLASFASDNKLHVHLRKACRPTRLPMEVPALHQILSRNLR